ncbi:MAG: helix-turn-helix domain-containing protein [Clostridia bacterium]|nr:helix-turn-helix domain-containing protein [Clostridia bacterium]
MSLYMVNTSPYFYMQYGLHTHECYELILNLEGEGIAMIGNSDYPFCPGSVHIIPPNTPHSKTSKNQFLDIYFHTDTLPLLPPSINKNEPIVFQDDNEKTLETLMKMMLNRYLHSNKHDPVLESMYELAMQIIRENCIKRHKDPDVESLIQQLAHTFQDPEISISDLLAGTGFQKDHIRRKFIAETGMTPNQYLTSLRITHAKQYLKKRKEMNLSITDIGALCGYYDPHYFARIFKQETGITPSKYAAEHRKA